MKRKYILALLLFMVTGSGQAAESTSFFPASREFQITYEAQVRNLPLDAQDIKIWVPLASTRENQRIKSREILTNGQYEIQKDPVYGNDILFIRSNDPKQEIYLVVNYEVFVDGNEEALQAEEGDLGVYLEPKGLMVISDDVKRRVSEVVPQDGSVEEKARAIYEHVIQTMSYDKTEPGWGKGDTIRACLVGKGNCTDFHSLFISMAQAAKIPARFKIGMTVPAGDQGKIAGYHCWAEYYQAGEGWKLIDASEAWKAPTMKDTYFGHADPNKFLLSVGRDIELTPRQEGDNRNFFFYPYVEVDGQEWNEMEYQFEYKNN